MINCRPWERDTYVFGGGEWRVEVARLFLLEHNKLNNKLYDPTETKDHRIYSHGLFFSSHWQMSNVWGKQHVWLCFTLRKGFPCPYVILRLKAWDLITPTPSPKLLQPWNDLFLNSRYRFNSPSWGCKPHRLITCYKKKF